MSRPVDQRGRLEQEPFGWSSTKNGMLRISFGGRVVTTVAGDQAARLVRRLTEADPRQAQLLLAKATGNFKHGNER